MRLDADAVDGWDCTLVVRGVEVPMLSPLDADEKSVVRREPRPGVVVRLWRWLFGEGACVADDAETEHVRGVVFAVTPPAFHGLVRELTGGELIRVLSAYLGAQDAWAEACKRRAYELMREELATRNGSVAHESAAPVETPLDAGHKEIRFPTTRLVPGRPLPDWMKLANAKPGTRLGGTGA